MKITKEDWASVSHDAHLIAFGKNRKPESERIDFALLVESDAGVPMQYATCREHDSDSLYFQFGGSFPGTKGTILSLRSLELLLNWIQNNGYQRISFLVENTNQAMLKLAMRCGFLITGVRYFKSSVLLEHAREF